MSEVGTNHPSPGRIDLPYRSKTDLVTEYLRSELQAGRPGAGERLVVSRVAERLGVSKVPVREAVTRLIGEGLLVQRPNVGPVVPDFTAHEVIETALIRVAIEGLALDSAAPLHTPESIDRLKDLLATMEGNDADFPALNVEFHLALIATCPYEEMVRLAGSLLERAQRYATVHVVQNYRAAAHAEHRQMFDCLTRGDTDQLKALNEHHVMHAAQELTSHMRKSQQEGTPSPTPA
jgi:DNA-binding GntR family transcriptional regulator